MITIDNYEAYLLQYAEGTLSKEVCAEVEAFLKDHPELVEEMDGLMDEDLRVTAPKIEMPSKRRLKHPMVMPMVWRWVAAACVVGIGVMIGIKMFAPQQEEMMIAQMTQPSESIAMADTIEEKLKKIEVESMKEIGKVETSPRKKSQEENQDWQRIEECDEDTSDVAIPIMAEAMEDDLEIASPLPMEEEQLIAMNEVEERVIMCDNLIKIVEEPKIIQSKELIKREPMSLDVALDAYVISPLKEQSVIAREKMTEQFYAAVDEIKSRYKTN